VEAFSENSSIQVYEQRPADFLARVECVACYLEVEGLLLLLQNSSEKSEPGRWGVPAGKLESFETLESGAQRELLEETGIAAPVCFFKTLYMRKIDLDYSFHIFKVLLDLDKTPIVSLSYEHQNYIWASKEDFKTLPLMVGAKEALEKYYGLCLF